MFILYLFSTFTRASPLIYAVLISFFYFTFFRWEHWELCFEFKLVVALCFVKYMQIWITKVSSSDLNTHAGVSMKVHPYTCNFKKSKCCICVITPTLHALYTNTTHILHVFYVRVCLFNKQTYKLGKETLAWLSQLFWKRVVHCKRASWFFTDCLVISASLQKPKSRILKHGLKWKEGDHHHQKQKIRSAYM